VFVYVLNGCSAQTKVKMSVTGENEHDNQPV